MAKKKTFWQKLGPGFVTGASDDDPAGIATYTIAGARYGLSVLWMTIITLPIMITIQEMSARIGRTSGRGLAGNMKKFYPRWMLFLVALIVIVLNSVNVGANMSAMAQSTALILPFPEKITAVVITLVILLVAIFSSYQKIFAIFKWLALSLFSYVLATFTLYQDWSNIFNHLFIPRIIFEKEFFLILVAFFGTTISPYLFFWQANQEAEERVIEQCKPGKICHLKPIGERELKDLKIDTRIGMSFSNLITFFIIVLSSATLFNAGINNIDNLGDAAKALRPLAGPHAQILFTVGIISSGFLSIPILSGSAAYVISEVFGWRQGLNKTFKKAKEFYYVMIASTLIGLSIPLLGFHPVRALFLTAIMYGVVSPLIILMIIHMANNRKVVGKHVNDRKTNFMGHISFAIMAFLSVFVFFVL